MQRQVAYKIGTLFFNPVQNSIFTIEDITNNDKGIMYTVKYLSPRKDGGIYSRYYTDRMVEFQEISNIKAKRAVKAIYGVTNV